MAANPPNGEFTSTAGTATGSRYLRLVADAGNVGVLAQSLGTMIGGKTYTITADIIGGPGVGVATYGATISLVDQISATPSTTYATHFPALRSSHELPQRPSPQKQILSNSGTLTLATGSGTPAIEALDHVTTLYAPLAGSQGLAKTGSGALVLTSAASALTGLVTVNGGTLEITKTITFGNAPVTSGRLLYTMSGQSDTPSITIAAGAIFEVNPTSTGNGNGNGNRNVNFSGGGTYLKTGGNIWDMDYASAARSTSFRHSATRKTS